jgi:hypothetical protein
MVFLVTDVISVNFAQEGRFIDKKCSGIESSPSTVIANGAPSRINFIRKCWKSDPTDTLPAETQGAWYSLHMVLSISQFCFGAPYFLPSYWFLQLLLTASYSLRVLWGKVANIRAVAFLETITAEDELSHLSNHGPFWTSQEISLCNSSPLGSTICVLLCKWM